MSIASSTSIREEVNNWITECMADRTITCENRSEWDHHLFDESWWVVDDVQAIAWLEQHGIDIFDAIKYVIAYYDELDLYFDLDILGEPKKLVSSVVSIYGSRLMATYNAYDIIELAESYT